MVHPPLDESAMRMLVRATVELLMRTSVALPIDPAVEALMDSVMMRPITAACELLLSWGR